MKLALTILMALATLPVHAQTMFVYGGRVAIGPRLGARGVARIDDLAFSPLRPMNPGAAHQLHRLDSRVTYACELRGQIRLVGVNAGTAAMLSEFRLARVIKCRPTRVRTMVAAHRGPRG